MPCPYINKMKETKRHIIHLSSTCKGRGGRGFLFLLTLLASLFVMPSCQEDEIPHDTTEVMMTFTTRAVVTQNNESDAIDIEKMNDLRVIVVRENGDIVYNNTQSVDGASTASVSFQTPVKTGGEDFKFFAIANYSSLVNAPDWANVNIDSLITHVVGDGSEISINSPIPQTKYWVYPVEQLLGETQYIRKTLDYLASKISVQFINNTNKPQSLSNIYITGITPNGKGRLFNRPTGEYDEGEEIYEEVYVDSDVTLDNNKITFGDVTNLSVDASSVIQHYYTYPVNAENIVSPTLHATWEGVGDKTLPIEINDAFIAKLKRNDHLKIIVTLTGQELTVNYTIADWEEHDTNIGGTSPTPEGGYDTEDWIADSNTDVVIGEEPEQGGGEEPEEPVEPGDVIWEGNQVIDWGNSGNFTLSAEDLEECYGNIICLVFDITGNSPQIMAYIKTPEGNDAIYETKYETNDNIALMEIDLNNLEVDDCYLFVNGVGVTLTQIYIKEATTQ